MPEENMINSDMNVVIIIDKDKLPEELREKLPQDLQDKLIKLLQEDDNFQHGPIDNIPQSHKDKQQGNLFTVQHGTVIGNIYKDGIFPEEKSFHKIKFGQGNDKTKTKKIII